MHGRFAGAQSDSIKFIVTLRSPGFQAREGSECKYVTHWLKESRTAAVNLLLPPTPSQKTDLMLENSEGL